MPVPCSNPSQFGPGQISLAQRFCAVLQLQQEIFPAPSHEQIWHPPADGVQRLDARAPRAQGGDDFGLVAIYAGGASHFSTPPAFISRTPCSAPRRASSSVAPAAMHWPPRAG